MPSSTQDHLSCWLSVRGSPTVSAVHDIAFHGVPSQTALCCGERSHVVCETVVFAAYFGSLWVLMSSSHAVAGLPRFQYPFCLV